MEKNNRKGSIYALFAASLWAFLAIALKFVTGELDPVTVVWFRFSIAFVVLALWTLAFSRGDFRIFLKPPALLFLAAIFLGLNYTSFIAGVNYVTPSTAQIFIQVGPVCFALAGIFIFREKANWMHLAGFLLVIGGMAVFFSETLQNLAHSDSRAGLGMLLVAGGGVAWAGFSVTQKKLVQQVRPNQLNLFIYAFNAVLLLPLATFSSLGEMTPAYFWVLLYTGVNTVLAYGSLALAIKWATAARVSVIITLNPIITFITMAILGKMEVGWIEAENFTIYSWLGAFTVIIGALIVIYAGRKTNIKN